VKVSNVNDPRDSGVGDRILQTASDLFYVDGLRGVGVNRIIEEADVAKSTLYRYFPTKEHLVLAYLDEMDRLWSAALRQAAGTDPTLRRTAWRGCLTPCSGTGIPRNTGVPRS
jgi:AcrR family transcriptional regulator